MLSRVQDTCRLIVYNFRREEGREGGRHGEKKGKEGGRKERRDIK